jgi:hypothetical protein
VTAPLGAGLSTRSTELIIQIQPEYLTV